MPMMMIHPDGTVSLAPRRFQDSTLVEDRKYSQETFEGVVGDLESDDPDFDSDTDTGGNA